METKRATMLILTRDNFIIPCFVQIIYLGARPAVGLMSYRLPHSIPGYSFTVNAPLRNTKPVPPVKLCPTLTAFVGRQLAPCAARLTS